jgi:hypothetical protein
MFETYAAIAMIDELSREEFVARCTCLLLLRHRPPATSIPLESYEATFAGDRFRVAIDPPAASRYDIFALDPATSPGGKITIGRSTSNSHVILDGGVSKHHATIAAAEGGLLLVVDTGSKNGTRVSGNKLVPGVPQPIASGDRVRFGPLEYRVVDALTCWELVHLKLDL